MSWKQASSIGIATVALATAALAQLPNDHCSGAIPIGPGTTLGSNAGATSGPDPLAGVGNPGADVWYSFVAPCNGAWAGSTCHVGTTFDTVLTIWDGSAGCGSILPILANDDFCGPPFAPTASYVTWQSVAGTTYYFSVAGKAGAAGAFELSVESILTELQFFSTGPGTIGYQVDGGPVNGTVFTAITLTSDFFPYGWFHGISISFPQLLDEITTGFPFVMTGGPVCGDVTVGPFAGLPPGLSVYGVTVCIPVGLGYVHPAFISAPASWTVP